MQETQPRARMKDIANRLNISITTVQRAFSNSDNILPTTRQKILGVAQQLNYKPNLNARALVKHKTNSIGLILGSVSNPIMESVISKVEDMLMPQNYRVDLAITHLRPDREKQIVNDMICRMTDGIIIHCGVFNTKVEAIDAILDSNIPCVVLGEYKFRNVSQVQIDFSTAGKDITGHLIDSGHKKVAFVYSFDNDPRLEGYKQAHADRGLVISPDLIFKVPYGVSRGMQFCDQILASGATAIFAYSDGMATVILEGLRMLKVKVPEQICLAGDGNDRFSCALGPPLTTYAHAYEEIPDYLVSMLLERIENPDAPIRAVVLRGQLIVRESTCRKP